MRNIFLLLCFLCSLGSLRAETFNAYYIGGTNGTGGTLWSAQSVQVIPRFHCTGTLGVYLKYYSPPYSTLYSTSTTVMEGSTLAMGSATFGAGGTTYSWGVVSGSTGSGVTFTATPYTLTWQRVDVADSSLAVSSTTVLYQDVYINSISTKKLITIQGQTLFTVSGTHSLSIAVNGSVQMSGTGYAPAGGVKTWSLTCYVGDVVTVYADGQLIDKFTVSDPGDGVSTITKSDQATTAGATPTPTPTPTPSPTPGASPTATPSPTVTPSSSTSLSNYGGTSGTSASSTLTRGDVYDAIDAAMKNNGVTKQDLYEAMVAANGTAATSGSIDIYTPVKQAMDDKLAEVSGSITETGSASLSTVQDKVNALKAAMDSNGIPSGIPRDGPSLESDPTSSSEFSYTIDWITGSSTLDMSIDSHPQLAALMTWLRNVIIMVFTGYFLAWVYQQIGTGAAEICGVTQMSVFQPLGESTWIPGESSGLSALRLAIVVVLCVVVATMVAAFPVLFAAWASWGTLPTSTSSVMSTVTGAGGSAYAYHLLVHLLPVGFLVTLFVNYCFVAKAKTFMITVTAALIKAIPGV
ncbi:MAG: hypothetical protein ACFUZC_07225 [Chthoniobacteraceae bacterium]